MAFALSSLSTASNGNIESIKRHELYYIPTADLCVLVEHVQFRIHRYFLERESTYFMRELAPTNKILSPSPLSGLPGSTESASIILDKLTADQFAQFLWVFYNPIYSPYDADVPTWSTILSLATRWEFPNIHDLCVRELEKLPMTDVQRIKLYQENRVDRNVLIPRYAALCQRPEPLTMEEGMELGMQTFAMIAAGRERVRWNARLPNGAMSPVSPPVDAKTEEIEEVVRTLFAIPPPQPSGAGAAATSSGALQSTATVTPKSTSTAPPQATQLATGKRPPAPLQVNTTKQEDKPAPAAASNKPTAQTPSTPLTGKQKKQQAKMKETIPQTPQTPTKPAGPQPWPTPTKESNNNNKTKAATKAGAKGKKGANESPKQKDEQQESVKDDDSIAASAALASSNDKTLPDVPASDPPVDSTSTPAPAPAPVDSSSASTTVDDPAAANPPADSSVDSSKPADTIDTTTTSTSTDPAPTDDANANTNPPNDTTTPTITADTNPIVPIPTDSNTTAAATTLISDDLSKLDDKTLDPTSATVQIDLLGDATGADPIGAVANVITGTGEGDWSGIFGTNRQSTAASETQAEGGEDAAGVNGTKLFDFSSGWNS